MKTQHAVVSEAKSLTNPTPSILKDVTTLLLKVVAIIAASALLLVTVFGIHREADTSMAPAIKDGDLVIYYRLDTTYALLDTVVLDFEGKRQVRRVVATEGDTVDITEDGLIVNGAAQQERHIFEDTTQFEGGVSLPLTLGKGEIFVLGDARESATDSRLYGVVKTADTHGKVMGILRRRGI